MTLDPTRKRTFLWLLLFFGAVAAVSITASRFVTFEEVKVLGQSATGAARANPLLAAAILASAHAACMALSLPMKAVLTLLSGALLGPILGWGATEAGVLVGTTVLFFAARRLLRARVEARLGGFARTVHERVSQRPVRAVAGLRLIVTLPYGPVTMAAALSSMRYRDFLVASVIGDAPITAIFVLAGERLASLDSPSDALSPTTLAVLIGAGFLLLASVLAARRAPTGASSRGPGA
ncbi:MAG: VTT domain-containing protein [Deltaproteobacteria bacterium]|nr:VTT domain-containing protein [Deltaproteobacteria bacterium]